MHFRKSLLLHIYSKLIPAVRIKYLPRVWTKKTANLKMIPQSFLSTDSTSSMRRMRKIPEPAMRRRYLSNFKNKHNFQYCHLMSISHWQFIFGTISKYHKIQFYFLYTSIARWFSRNKTCCYPTHMGLELCPWAPLAGYSNNYTICLRFQCCDYSRYTLPSKEGLKAMTSWGWN